MSELELANLGSAELEMTTGEFAGEMEAEIEASIEASIESAMSSALEEIKIKYPDANLEGLSSELKVKMPEIKSEISSQVKIETGKQLDVSGSEIPSDFDKQLSKTVADNIPVKELSQKIMNDALKGGVEDGVPKKENLTDEQIQKSTEKIVGEEVKTIQQEISKGLSESGGDIYENNVKANGGKSYPEAKEAVKDTMGELADPEFRTKTIELGDEITSDKPTDDPQVEEGRKWRDKIKERWDKTNFKAGVGNLFKLAAVVAGIMMLTKGGRKLLKKGADEVGDELGGAVDTIGAIISKILSPIFESLKNLLKKLEKWAVYALIFLLGVGLVYFVFKLILGRLINGGGDKTVKIEMQKIPVSFRFI